MKPYRVAIIAAVAVVVVVVGWYAAFWHPEGSRLKTARSNEAQAAAQVSTDRMQLMALKAQEPKVAKEETVYKKLVQAVPDGPSLDQLLRTVNSAASSAGVALTAVGAAQPSGWGTSSASSPAAASTGASASSASATPIGVDVSINGTNAQVLKFVTALDKQPRLYVVQSFNLTNGSATGGAQSTGINVEAFYVSAASNNPTFPG